MKNTEFIRKVDSLGRIVIPKDLRSRLNINEYDDLELYFDNNKIIIDKYLNSNRLRTIINYINSTKDLLNTNIYIISNLNSNIELSPGITELIKLKKEYYSSTIESISVNNQRIDGYLAIVPLLRDSEIICSIIIRKDSLVNQYDQLYINMIKRFVENLNYL